MEKVQVLCVTCTIYVRGVALVYEFDDQRPLRGVATVIICVNKAVSAVWFAHAKQDNDEQNVTKILDT